MKKRLQNKIAESGLSLPVTGFYAVAVWLLAGLVTKGLWPQLLLFAVSAYIMVELSNSNALLRIRSRMVTCSFLVLSCIPTFTFASLSGAFVAFCFIAATLILLRTYQDDNAAGEVFYAFAFVGIASLFFVQALFFLPLLWILMATQLQSLSKRTFASSMLGTLLPYWLVGAWLALSRNVAPIVSHFSGLSNFGHADIFSHLSIEAIASYFFIVMLLIVGIIHFLSTRFEDRIRIRQLFGFFATTGLFTILLIALLPQHFDPLFRIAAVCVSPLTAHFIALTHSKFTNVCSISIMVTALLLTAFNLFGDEFRWTLNFILDLWSGF